jgi:hypothetical protein
MRLKFVFIRPSDLRIVMIMKEQRLWYGCQLYISMNRGVQYEENFAVASLS